MQFLRDELQYENGYERQKSFHGNDKHISVDELWNSWRNSQVHNWTVEETLQWLELSVELPQYVSLFIQHQVDGSKLPSTRGTGHDNHGTTGELQGLLVTSSCVYRLATHKDNFLSQVLGIKDPIHKHKISVKAMDVVLFGPPKSHNYVKDAVLVFAVVMALGGLWFALMQHRYAKRHLRKMMTDLESLHNAEESLRQLQCKLDQARHEQELVVTEKRNLEKRLQDEIATIKVFIFLSHPEIRNSVETFLSLCCCCFLSPWQQREASSPDLASLARAQQLEAELTSVQAELRRTERALEACSWTPPPQLQHWLQLTHEMELHNYNAKRARAEQQLQLAKEGCEKLNKRRSTFLGTFKVAHGNSINDIDNRILQARAALAELTGDLQERTLRWKQIEQLCGFPIVHNPGMLFLETLVRRAASPPLQPPAAAAGSFTFPSSRHTLWGNIHSLDKT
ncbi:STIM2 [Cordylochernes scorpioides]|uniref:STIM2 n=1 Tax=Cordylochernes scorpioides TaxID=51811 RepID=A0ABY6L369_9ARAC|nr:STIM2 [Cordylochernes scorpioides]